MNICQNDVTRYLGFPSNLLMLRGRNGGGGDMVMRKGEREVAASLQNLSGGDTRLKMKL